MSDPAYSGVWVSPAGTSHAVVWDREFGDKVACTGGFPAGRILDYRASGLGRRWCRRSICRRLLMDPEGDRWL